MSQQIIKKTRHGFFLPSSSDIIISEKGFQMKISGKEAYCDFLETAADTLVCIGDKHGTELQAAIDDTFSYAEDHLQINKDFKIYTDSKTAAAIYFFYIAFTEDKRSVSNIAVYDKTQEKKGFFFKFKNI